MTDLKYPRVLLKLSGEALAGEKGTGYDFDAVSRILDEVVAVIKTGASVGLVIGGGADGIHKIVKVFTSFFDSVSATNEERERRERSVTAPVNLG